MTNKYLASAAFCSLLVSGCAGTMNGMVRESGERVTLSYQQGMAHDNLQVTLPDGEIFTGKAVMVGHTSGVGVGFNSFSASNGMGASTFGTGTNFMVVETYSGNLQGVLFGDRGNTMQCRFRYADASGYTTSGGVGLCETSNGRVVDVQW